MPNHRFETFQLAFDTDHAHYWSNLSRINNLLVIMNISLFFLTGLVANGYFYTCYSLACLGAVGLGGCTEYKVICSGMIANAFQKVGYPIVPALLPASHANDHRISDPYGTKLIMRHYSQIVPRDFDLSPNFEIVKYNIIGLGRFDYKSIWANE
jgi:hypothetical protein